MLGAGVGLTGLPARTGSDTTTTRLVLAGSSVPEDASAGVVVATLSVVGPDYLAPASYALTSDPSNNFEIIGNELRVKASATLDFETDAIHLINLEATDANPTVYTRDTGIFVTNVNEQPTDIALSANSIPENAQPGSIIGALSTTDVDVGDMFTYTIDQDVDAKFAISGDNLTVRAGAAFDFEAFTSHAVTVRSTDVGGEFTTKIFAIGITNINEAPTAITISSGSLNVPEDAADLTTIITLATTDEDAGDTHTYSQITVSSDFETTSAGVVRVKAGATLTVGATNITVRSTDSGGLIKDETFSVNVTAVSGEFDYTIYSELNGWIKAATADVTLNGATSISSATDKSASAADFTQASAGQQPQLITDGMGVGLFAIKVTGNTQILSAVSSRTVKAVALSFKINNSGEILFVATDGPADDLFIREGDVSFDGTLSSQKGRVATDGGVLSASGSNISNSPNLNVGETYIMWLEWDVAEPIKNIFNRVPTISLAGGSIGEMLMFGTTPSDTDRDTIIAQLIADWPK